MITAVIGIGVILEESPLGLISLYRKSTKYPDQSAVALAIIVFLLVPTSVHYTIQADIFGNAIKNINEQQVHIGQWLAENTPEDAVFAIHDAGALRFFSNRTVIDLAGLVSPDIIHGNMTVRETLEYLHNHSCNYFVFFDELFEFWGALLGGNYVQLYTIYLPDNIISGRDTMSVFLIDWEGAGYE
ncbi:MAG: hypothetical protein ACFE7R_06990 [Candidatus Hodarchaeota archaeon]